MIEPFTDQPRAITLGAGKAYDAEDFVNELHSMSWMTCVTQNVNGHRSAIDGRTTRHGIYAVNLRIRDTDRGIFRLDQGHCRADEVQWA